MSYIWQIAPELDKKTQNKFPELPPLVLQLLHNRDLTSQEQIDEFLNPDYGTDLHDPFLFVDMEKAVKRILEALESQEKIIVYGDYDADGVSATAVLASTLRALGGQVEVYIPFRETEGYGLNAAAAEELAQAGTKLIITVDCGIANAAEVEQLNQHGVDSIITDHHQEPLKLPKAFAIINQNTSRDTYPDKHLAGTGVAFKLVQGLLKRQADYKVKPLDNSWEKWLLDLVAIGTVADMVPVRGENRTLVKYGLVVLRKTKRIGLQQLMRLASTDLVSLTERSIGFQIAPRLNAAGRLEHANTAYELLVTDNQTQAKKLAESINTTNQQRQQLTDQIRHEALKLIGEPDDRYLISAVGEGWPTGIVGLIAGRVTDQFYRPSLIISRFGGDIIGSGRSIAGFNIVKALQACDQHLARYGGHAQACGFTIKDESHLKPFLEKMERLAEHELTGQNLARSLRIDASVQLKDIDWEFFEILEQFAPFGEGNPKPKFLATGLNITEIQTVGQTGQHLRLMVAQAKATARKTIGFGFGDWQNRLQAGDRVDLVFEVDVNEWNGNRELQLKIVDLKLSDE